MAKVSYIDIAPELENAFWSGLQPGDRFMFSRIRRKIVLLSVKRKKGLTQRSLLPQIAEAWQLLTEEQKGAWGSAGAQSNLNGYRLFVQDQALRIKNELPGTATPNLLHQSLVGQLHIEAPATELKIIQHHPHFYYVWKKVGGKKGSYQAVLVNEDFALPLTISLNYKSDLTPQSGGAFARMYARVWHSYQGQDLHTDLQINLDFATDWKNATAVLSSLAGYIVRYNLYIHLFDLQGDLFVDNIKAEHSAQNWVRDTYCKDINQGFTRAFYQVPKHWTGVIAPEGSWFESIYKDF